MKPDDLMHRPILGNGEPTVDGLSPVPEADGRERVLEHDPTNAWGERVVAGEGEYPGPEALRDEAPDTEPNATHEGHAHNGAWPGLER